MLLLGVDWPLWLKIAADILVIIASALGGHAVGSRKK